MTAVPFLVQRPGREVAHVFHSGAYEHIEDAYNALLTWIHQAGYQVAGHPTEAYLVGPSEMVRPEDYLTEVIIPVRQSSPGHG